MCIRTISPPTQEYDVGGYAERKGGVVEQWDKVEETILDDARAKRAAHVKCWRPCSATTKRNQRLEHCCRSAEYTLPNEDVREWDLGKLGRLEERDCTGGGKEPAAPPSKMHYCSGWSPNSYQDHGPIAETGEGEWWPAGRRRLVA